MIRRRPLLAPVVCLLLVGLLPGGPARGATDVGPDHPFAADIAWADDLGIVEGYPDGTFRPQLPVSRQVLAALLHRLWLALGQADPGPVDPDFADVSAAHPFASDIAWATGLQIASGYPDGTFRPLHPVSRQTVATMLHQFWLALDEVDPDPSGTDFVDVPPTHPFADDIAWAATLEITSGYPDATYRPLAAVTRGSGAAMLHRLADAYGLLVHSPADTVDASPGDGRCADATGACTLRAALMEADADPGPDTVRLRADPVLAIDGPGEDGGLTGDLDVTDDLVLDGAGHAIDGGGLDRVLDVHAGTIEVRRVTVEGGVADDGGGIRVGDGASLTLTEATVAGNESTDLDECRIDYAVFSITCTPGPPSGGGGIWAAGDLTLVGTTVSGNTAGVAEPCSPDPITPTITICRHATGGGIQASAALAVDASTIADNTAAGWGGGISTIGVDTTATLALSYSTVAGNEGAPMLASGGVDGVSTANTVVSFTASIVDGGTHPVCRFSLGAVSHGPHNVTGDLSCDLGSSGGSAGVDIVLGPLSDNGGPTWTRLPLGPPVQLIDRIPTSSPLCTAPVPDDQRGVARPQGAACDPGAVEQ